MIPREIRTARLVLTPPAFSDNEAIHALYDDPAVHKWAPSVPTFEDNTRYYSELIPPAGLTEPPPTKSGLRCSLYEIIRESASHIALIGMASFFDPNERVSVPE